MDIDDLIRSIELFELENTLAYASNMGDLEELQDLLELLLFRTRKRIREVSKYD